MTGAARASRAAARVVRRRWLMSRLHGRARPGGAARLAQRSHLVFVSARSTRESITIAQNFRVWPSALTRRSMSYMPWIMEAGIDASVPHSARIWNYWMGGKDNYPVDREAGDRYAAQFPGIIDMARHS